MSNEFEQRCRLQSKWRDITGQEIPSEIAAMSIHAIKRRIALLEDKNTVCGIPRKPTDVQGDGDAIDDWDRQDMKNGNAYGS